VVVIVLDLSDPGSVLDTAGHWLDLVRQKLAATYSLFEKRGLQQLPAQLKARQQAKVLGQQHPDAALVDCPGGCGAFLQPFATLQYDTELVWWCGRGRLGST
jgi:hypothetical protein